MFSTAIYVLKTCGVIESATWCTEIYGFVWGILLFHIKDRIIRFSRKTWVLKCIAFCLVAGVLGISYLKMKTVILFGDYLLKIVLGTAIIGFILLLNTKISIGNKISRFLGKISFEIYLLHGIAFGFVALLFPSIKSGMFVLISICMTVIVSWLVHNISQILVKEYRNNESINDK